MPRYDVTFTITVRVDAIDEDAAVQEALVELENEGITVLDQMNTTVKEVR